MTVLIYFLNVLESSRQITPIILEILTSIKTVISDSKDRRIASTIRVRPILKFKD